MHSTYTDSQEPQLLCEYAVELVLVAIYPSFLHSKLLQLLMHQHSLAMQRDSAIVNSMY